MVGYAYTNPLAGLSLHGEYPSPHYTHSPAHSLQDVGRISMISVMLGGGLPLAIVALRYL